MRRPAPAQGQRKQGSGLGKALLIAGLVLGITGCLGISALGFLYSLSQQNGAADGANTFANPPHFQVPPPPPPETDPNPSHAAHPPGGQKVFGMGEGMDDGLIDVPGTHQETFIEPGCYLNEALFVSDQDLGADAPWEFETIISREKVPCSAGRRGKLSAQARQMSQDWPFNEEILKVEELAPPRQVTDEDGLLQKSVRVHTKVSANRP